MNNWILLSFLAALLWGIVNILDKVIVVTQVKFHWSRMILDSIVGLTVCLFLVLVGVSISSNLKVILISVVAGLLLYCFNYLYYKALETADVSVVSAWLQSVPVFSAVWGVIFFQEIYGWIVYVGVLFVILGSVFVNAEEKETYKLVIINGKNWKNATLYIIPGVFILSINYALQKYLLQFSDTWTIFFWARIGAFLFTMTVLITSKKIRDGFGNTVRNLGARSYFIIGIIEWINLAGVYFLLKAYSIGSVTLVTTVSAIQPVLVLILSVACSWIFKQKKQILPKVNSSVFLVRLISLLFIIIGTLLIVQ
jgi:uncharacterized membrane protein